MAADLTIVESVGQALTEWTPQGSLIPIAETIYSLGKTLFDDSPDIDSVAEYQKETNENLEQMVDTLTQNNSEIQTLTESINNLSNGIDAFMGFQYFVFGTMFSIVIAGYLGTRVKRLISWKKIKKKEGLL